MSLHPSLRSGFGYVLGFAYLTSYWDDDDHLPYAASCMTSGPHWSSVHCRLCLPLVPLVASWLGDPGSATVLTAPYGLVLVLVAVAYRPLAARA